MAKATPKRNPERRCDSCVFYDRQGLVSTGNCTRFPQWVRKRGTDWCWEWKSASEDS
jgi:hypothetical protein